MQLNIRPWESLIKWNCIQLLPSLENLESNLKFFRDNYLILVLLSVFYNYVIYEFFDVNLINNALNVAITICIVVTHACFYNRPQLPSGCIVNDQDNLSRSDDTLTETNHQTRQCFYDQNKRNFENSCNNSNKSQNSPSSNFNYSRFRNSNVSDDDVNDQDDFNRPNNTLSYHQNQTNTMYQIRNRRNVENFSSNNTIHRKSPSPNSNESRNRFCKSNKNHRKFIQNFENHSANSQNFARMPKFPRRKNTNKCKKKEYDSNINCGCILSILVFCFAAYLKINEAAIKPLQITSFNSTNTSCALS